MNFDVNGNLEAGIHDITMEELQDIFVNSFPSSNTRPVIFSGYYSHDSHLKELNITIEKFVDGSYVTKKNDPRDIDFLCIADALEVDNLPDDKKHLLSNLIDNECCKNAYMCDVYFLASLPEDHPNYPQYRCMRKYWMGEFGFDRQERAKGFVRMGLKPC